MYFAQLIHASHAAQLSPTDWRALVQIQMELDPLEYRTLKINVLRRKIGATFRTTARSVRRLIEFGDLVEGPEVDGRRTYRLRVPSSGVSIDTSRSA